MKRTRHIEITTYSRRVTMTHGSDAAAEPESTLSAVEIITDMREVIASALDDLDDGHLMANQAAMVRYTPRPLHGLRDWLRKYF